MMGEKSSAQGQLFYQFNLDEVVPADHMLRKIDAVLDLSDLRAQLAHTPAFLRGLLGVVQPGFRCLQRQQRHHMAPAQLS